MKRKRKRERKQKIKEERKNRKTEVKSQTHRAHLHRCPRRSRGVLWRGHWPLGGAGGARPARGCGRPESPRRCRAPGSGRWGRCLPEPTEKPTFSLQFPAHALSALPQPFCLLTCSCLGRREGKMRPGQSHSFTDGVRK